MQQFHFPIQEMLPQRKRSKSGPAKPPRAGYGPHCKVIPVGNEWAPDFRAEWNGQRSPASFNSAGAARAFLASCDIARKLRY